ncbi:MAG: hypothetical protein GY804_00445, partial [Alphaproteobacteria bacterium]|nr:hypothetical protein [Alphaproteobacteria bacterium]
MGKTQKKIKNLLNWKCQKPISRQHEEERVGGIDYIFAIILFLITAFNLIDQSYKGQSIINRSIYTAPYLVIAIITIIKGWRYSFKISLFMIGMIVIYDSTPENLTGAIFICFSALLIKHKIYSFALITSTIIVSTIRSMIYNDSIPQAFASILGFLAIYTIFYFIAYKPSIQKQSKIHTLTEDENQLLTYLAYEDISQKEAGALMELKPN